MKNNSKKQHPAAEPLAGKCNMKPDVAELSSDEVLQPPHSKRAKKAEEFRLSHLEQPILHRPSCIEAVHRFGKRSGST
jgi:hypothetical protein